MFLLRGIRDVKRSKEIQRLPKLRKRKWREEGLTKIEDGGLLGFGPARRTADAADY
jgi:hypothetical protein